MKRFKEKMVYKPRKGLEILSHTLGRNQPCWHLELRLLPSRNVTQYVSVGEGPQSVGYSSPRKLIHGFYTYVNYNSLEAHTF